jgi:hypothetical protein
VRSPVELGLRNMLRRVAASVALGAWLSSAVAAHPGRAPPQAPPTEAQVQAALAQLNEDPNLGVRRNSSTLRWRSSDEPERRGNWREWIAAGFRWLATTARALLWVAGILTVGILAMYIKRFLELRGGEHARALPIRMPTHVRELDIRPEHLPEDIGASALRSWESGEHRAALALLYRGMLSRLVHAYAFPIRDSSTEGDCLQLARSHLQTAPAAYVARLIRVWQRAVYGGVDPTAGEMRALCAEFDAAIGKPLLVSATGHAA